MEAEGPVQLVDADLLLGRGNDRTLLAYTVTDGGSLMREGGGGGGRGGWKNMGKHWLRICESNWWEFVYLLVLPKVTQAFTRDYPAGVVAVPPQLFILPVCNQFLAVGCFRS